MGTVRVQPRRPTRFRGYTVRVASRTEAGKYTHKVTVGPTGEVVCTCRGFEQWGHCWASKREKEKFMTTQTEPGTALVPIKPEPPKSILPSKQELNIIGTIAKTAVLARGHAVPQSIDSAAKAAAVMLAGHELGIKPMTALRHIFVVNGRTEPDAQVMAGIVMAHEPDATFEIIKLDDKACTMRLRRPSRGPNATWEYTYELADADKAGLLKKGGPWQQFPKDMMRWAATKRLCRVYAPDLINSVGAVEVTAVQDLLAAAEEEPEGVIDVKSLPNGELYNEGDVPDNVDRETGEIIDDDGASPIEAEESPGSAVPASVEDPQQAPVSASDGATTEPGQSPVETPAAASPTDLRASLERLLKDTSESFGAEWLPVFKDLSQFMPDGKARFDPKAVEDARLQDVISFLRKARGEPTDD